MCIARLTLDAVRDVEDHARSFMVQHLGHELFEAPDEVFISLKRDDLVAPLLQCVGDATDRLEAVLFSVGLPE